MNGSAVEDHGPIEEVDIGRLDAAQMEKARRRLHPLGPARAVRLRETGRAPYDQDFVFLSRAADVCHVLRDPATFALTPYDCALGEITNGVSFFLSADAETIERRRALRAEVMGHDQRRAESDDLHLEHFSGETARAVTDSLLLRSGPRARFDAVREYATFVPYLTAVRAFGIAGTDSPGWLVHVLQLLRAASSRRLLHLTPETQAMQSLLAWTLLPTGHIFSNVRGRDGRVRWLASAMSKRLEARIDAALEAPELAGPDTLIGRLEAARRRRDRDPQTWRDDARSMVYEFVGSVTVLVSQGFCRVLEMLQARGLDPAATMDQMRDPDTAHAYIDEALRLHSPTGQLQRVAQADAELDGLAIRTGDHLFLLIDQASCDAARFDNPELFDAARPAGDYVHFGCRESPHACFGQNWARAIIRQMLLQMARLPELEFLPPPRGRLKTFNGFPESLLMVFRPAAEPRQ